ncbi:wings apart-like protein 2 isoform X1 [Aegilops tauschii subsp. strangulata]|uniref:Wings apart-like protein C-terminal domain-containing protein n=3 Tax=Aegilops tauschii subsp. strangulata TaxID=200361 RepID=A0A452XAV6_AEGTS|nr:wings apart-like protein 2 isoform X1 [Aegilops tauschii subsp. strangulata]
MIVRTYGRRSRTFSDGAAAGGGGGDRGLSSSQDAFAFDGGDGDDELAALGSSASQPFPPSQESSSMWDFDEDPPTQPPPPRLEGPRRKGRRGRHAEPEPEAATATLMEAEEYGEMMESVDEVNFALDGLRPTAPRRVRRASLLALLGICASAARRRVLRAQGLVKQIIDNVLALNIDDPSCGVAAAALLFVLASDVQENHVLNSESCIRFLLKLLNPPMDANDVKAPSIGSKLLGISKVQMFNGSNKDSDSSSEDIISKVEEILLSCKEIKPLDRDGKRASRPELCSKWLALLTMEKACLSAVALEETSDMVTRVGGDFKETLRALGGLDNIFDVMVDCHSSLEGIVKDTSTLSLETSLQSAALLLKCLKILENATFLSDQNKTHLLSMSRKLSPRGSTVSLVGVIINIVELLSVLSLLQNSSTVSISTDKKSSKGCKGGCSADIKGATTLNGHGKGKNSKQNKLSLNQKCQNCSSSKLDASHISISSTSDVGLSQMTLDCSQSTSSNRASSGSLGERHSNGLGLGLKLNIRKERGKANPIRGSSGWVSITAHSSDGTSREMAKRRRLSENGNSDLRSGSGSDPFAFDDVDQEPELFGQKKRSTHGRQAKSANEKLSDDRGIAAIGSQESYQPEDNHHLGATSHSNVDDDSNLLEDCLLASIKVLMNLANDNPSGCEHIASCGGLNTMASLIIKHFPSFDFSADTGRDVDLLQDLTDAEDSKACQVKAKQLRDHELDFLVAILGLLVNLVEKDSLNRVRLASARVSVGLSKNAQSEKAQRDVIPLLCSIFLASKGSGEASATISPDDEESMLQGAREAEMMIVEAYAALVLGFLSIESMKVRGAISSCLPNNNLKVLVPVLEKFVAFHLQLNMMTDETHSSVTEVIEKCKL